MVRLIPILLLSICIQSLQLFAYDVGDTVLLSGKTIQRGDIVTSPGEYVVEDIKNENPSGLEVIQINGAWVSGTNMAYISLVTPEPDERTLLNSRFEDRDFSYNNFVTQNLPPFWFVYACNYRITQQVYYIASTNSWEEHFYLDSMNIIRLEHNYQPTTIFYPDGFSSNTIRGPIVNDEYVYYTQPSIDLEPDSDFYMYLDEFSFQIVVTFPNGEEVLTLNDFSKLSNGNLQLKREGEFPQSYRKISTYANTDVTIHGNSQTSLQLNTGLYWKSSKPLVRNQIAIDRGYDISKYTPLFLDPSISQEVSYSPITGSTNNQLRVYHSLNMSTNPTIGHAYYRLSSNSATQL